jgi:hypothetical protein
MQGNGKMICKIFEQEMWLYIDRTLPDERMDFWRNHLRGCNSCNETLSLTEDVLSTSAQSLSFDLSDELYNKMIEKAVSKKRSFLLGTLFKKEKKRLANFGKIVFASALVIFAVVFSLISDKPNRIKTVSKDILDWNGNIINEQLNDINNRLELIQSENMEGWSRELNGIDKKLDNLEGPPDPLSFY